ncbi:tripartite tricarboxylate transporter substrate binding protein [Ramlibacter alkalitolerans]|uniref:Tripartite tricarboxylate transporter substrate binding protein n=1 Tax=Ramlibacter alkalitolerans TaxID=2039631 RepID=A0ABS1JLS1_9BURK|nr:tripartite tricarboxylate transporter substrate binding protein [Ramlibacter alkalitolerans]MBL0425183.1 tripartite tricarboxylate transporter substrate binding protein [Ramlibacter alkalitolerans]
MHLSLSRRRLVAAAVGAAAFAAAGPALAQESYPSRPITIVVPYPPGGSNDVFARAIGKRLSEALGQPVVIDNKPGAGGTLGTSIVAKAAPDGYTLGAVSSSFVTNAAVQPRLPFDPMKNLTPVAMMARGPFVVAVRADLPVNTPADLVALARKQPGKINYASSGPGSTNQFATELLKNKAQIFLTHIPYRGMAPATTDLMAGTVDLLIASGPSLQPALRSGKARAIAVTSLKPSVAAPGLPPMADAAPGFEFSIWWGLLAPGGTPDAVVQKLNAAVNRIVQTPEMREFFLREGAEPAQLGAADFAAEVRRAIPYWQDIARSAGIQAE